MAGCGHQPAQQAVKVLGATPLVVGASGQPLGLSGKTLALRRQMLGRRLLGVRACHQLAQGCRVKCGQRPLAAQPRQSRQAPVTVDGEDRKVAPGGGGLHQPRQASCLLTENSRQQQRIGVVEQLIELGVIRLGQLLRCAQNHTMVRVGVEKACRAGGEFSGGALRNDAHQRARRCQRRQQDEQQYQASPHHHKAP
nr:hypothetical protein [uncultured Halomonas sp.]